MSGPPPDPEEGAPPTGMAAALKTARGGALGLCPRCGATTLFAGHARFADRCRACGLDYRQFNVGDGPAAFLTLIVGALVATSAVLLDLRFHPPFWVHVVLWVPITAGLVILALRAAKGALLALQYRTRAAEGRLDQP